MQFTKPMIELVFELRRLVPSELKPAIKLANPDLFDELYDYYQSQATSVTKALIKELFHLAGDPWHSWLASGDANVAAAPQQALVYRGQTQWVAQEDGKTAAAPESDNRAAPETDAAKIQRKTRIYRGQIIQD